MLTLEMIQTIENRYGNIYQIAEDLLQKCLPSTIVEDILSFVECDLDDRPADQILAHLLLDVLEPIDAMGALSLGEDYPVEDDVLTFHPSVGFSWV